MHTFDAVAPIATADVSAWEMVAADVRRGLSDLCNNVRIPIDLQTIDDDAAGGCGPVCVCVTSAPPTGAASSTQTRCREGLSHLCNNACIRSIDLQTIDVDVVGGCDPVCPQRRRLVLSAAHKRVAGKVCHICAIMHARIRSIDLQTINVDVVGGCGPV